MKLQEVVADMVRSFDIDTTNCDCETCVSLRPQVHRVRGYLMTRHVDVELMHAITDPTLKQALIEEICLRALNAKEE